MNFVDYDPGQLDWPVKISSAVVMQAIRDMQGSSEEDALTAIEFIFGNDEPAAGWLGMLGISARYARPKVIRYLERREESAPVPKDRRDARLALVRIRRYVRNMIAVHAATTE